jgi:hypothetical protein
MRLSWLLGVLLKLSIAFMAAAFLGSFELGWFEEAMPREVFYKSK